MVERLIIAVVGFLIIYVVWLFVCKKKKKIAEKHVNQSVTLMLLIYNISDLTSNRRF